MHTCSAPLCSQPSAGEASSLKLMKLAHPQGDVLVLSHDPERLK